MSLIVLRSCDQYPSSWSKSVRLPIRVSPKDSIGYPLELDLYQDSYEVWQRYIKFDSVLLNELYGKHLVLSIAKYLPNDSNKDNDDDGHDDNDDGNDLHEVYESRFSGYNTKAKEKTVRMSHISRNPNLSEENLSLYEILTDSQQVSIFRRMHRLGYKSLINGKFIDIKPFEKIFAHTKDIRALVNNSTFWYENFVRNPGVTCEFLKKYVTHNKACPKTRRIGTSVNPHYGWDDTVKILIVNDVMTENEPNTFHLNLRSSIDLDRMSEILQKKDIPNGTKIHTSFARGIYRSFQTYKDTKWSLDDSTNSLIYCADKLLTLGFQASRSDGIRVEDLKNYKDYDPVILENPMIVDKLMFFFGKLTPAATKIQRWWLQYYYRPGSKYFNKLEAHFYELSFEHKRKHSSETVLSSKRLRSG